MIIYNNNIIQHNSTKTTVIYIVNQFNILFSGPRVTKVVLDFEKAAWNALDEVLPNTSKMGCSFHFKQAVMKRIRTVGLINEYVRDGATSDILHRLINLCYIPASSIQIQFEILEAECQQGKYIFITSIFLLHLLFLSTSFITSLLQHFLCLVLQSWYYNIFLPGITILVL